MNQLTARFTISSVENLIGPTGSTPDNLKYGEQVCLAAVYSSDPANPNYSYSHATPAATMQMTVSNPSAFDFFVPGKEYDLVICPMPDTVEIEDLARQLHEAGREAVEKNLIVRTDVPSKGFMEWDDITEAAREGRRVQARYLLSNFDISRRQCITVPAPSIVGRIEELYAEQNARASASI